MLESPAATATSARRDLSYGYGCSQEVQGPSHIELAGTAGAACAHLEVGQQLECSDENLRGQEYLPPSLLPLKSASFTRLLDEGPGEQGMGRVPRLCLSG